MVVQLCGDVVDELLSGCMICEQFSSTFDTTEFCQILNRHVQLQKQISK